MSFVSAFNKILIEFAKNLETTFPEDTDFLVFRRGIEDLTKYNSLAAIQMFQLYVAPVEHKNENGEKTTVDIKQKILNNDLSFFVDKMDYKTVLENNGADYSSYFNTINKLKQYWSKLSPQGQEDVMKYMSSLIKVSEQVN
jgi:hypothetical protein